MPQAARQTNPKCIVLGGGLAGLSAAYHFGKQAVVYEAESRPGGECVTDRVGAYHFDKSGHLLHLRNPQIRQFIKRLLPGKLNTIKRDARIQLSRTEFAYPFQANIRGLPGEIKRRALCEYLEAVSHTEKRPDNFLQWARQNFGRTISDLFLEPYNRKLWTVDPSELTLDWMGAYMPRPEIARVVQGAFYPDDKTSGYNAEFLYPKSGGIGLLADTLAKKIPQLNLNARAVRLDLRKRTVDIIGHGRLAWKQLISTIPLPALVALLESPPQAVLEAMQQLQWNSVVVVNFGVARAKVHDAHWLYFPEKKYPFYRVGFPGNFGKVAPPGHSTLYAEVALPAGTGWDTRVRIAGQVRQGLIEADILKKRDTIKAEHFQYIPYAYVIFDSAYAAAKKRIIQYLNYYGIICIGRWGRWEYSAMEDAMLAGKQAAQETK